MGEIEKSHKWLQKFSKRCDNSCENLLREEFEAFFGGCDDSCKETLEEFKSHLLAVKPNP